MPADRLHIVSFGVPDPPDFGGAIDVFYKIKALSRAGLAIVLHAWTYDGREPGPELSALCTDIRLYPRQTHWSRAVGTTPYIIASRSDRALTRALAGDRHPVLLEGMHNAGLLGQPELAGRTVLLRMHNLEWEYYRQLAAQTSHWLQKSYFLAEAWRLSASRHVLGRADRLLAISEKDRAELSREFPRVVYLPAFHPYNEVQVPAGTGSYALYHGNLAVAENRRAAEWLMASVFDKLDMPLVVAGNRPPRGWADRWKRAGIDIVADPSENELSSLVSGAQVHALPTFQDTGVKLKLLRALFRGRHVVVNPDMVAGSGSLAGLCRVADSAEAMRRLLRQCRDEEVGEEAIAGRQALLAGEFNNDRNAGKLIAWLGQPR